MSTASDLRLLAKELVQLRQELERFKRNASDDIKAVCEKMEKNGTEIDDVLGDIKNRISRIELSLGIGADEDDDDPSIEDIITEGEIVDEDHPDEDPNEDPDEKESEAYGGHCIVCRCKGTRSRITYPTYFYECGEDSWTKDRTSATVFDSEKEANLYLKRNKLNKPSSSMNYRSPEVALCTSV